MTIGNKQVNMAKYCAHTLGLLILVAAAISAWQIEPHDISFENIFKLFGLCALTFLLLTLTVTPLSRLLHAPLMIKLRRPLGLWSFAFAVCHVSIFFSFKLRFHFSLLPETIMAHPFIILGELTFLILTILALTSNKRSMNKLGPKWRKLHKLIYLAIISACAHFFFSSNPAQVLAMIYAALAAILLLSRLIPTKQSIEPKTPS